MKRFLNTLFFTLLLAAIAGAGIFVGYSAVIGRESHSFDDSTILVRVAPASYAPLELYAEPVMQMDSYSETFLPESFLRFEYYNRSGNTVDAWEMEMPLALVDGTTDDLRAVFPDWNLSSYSRTGAYLRREASAPPVQSFFVTTTSEGLIVVYYDDSIDGSRLKEITNTTTASLPETEKERLLAGIFVQGENALIRLLEDLGS